MNDFYLCYGCYFVLVRTFVRVRHVVGFLTHSLLINQSIDQSTDSLFTESIIMCKV